jgi:hypothetical protein
MEKFYVYTEYMDTSHLNDEYIFPNKIFVSLIKPGSLRTQPSVPAPLPHPTYTISKDGSL